MRVAGEPKQLKTCTKAFHKLASNIHNTFLKNVQRNVLSDHVGGIVVTSSRNVYAQHIRRHTRQQFVSVFRLLFPVTMLQLSTDIRSDSTQLSHPQSDTQVFNINRDGVVHCTLGDVLQIVAHLS